MRWVLMIGKIGDNAMGTANIERGGVEKQPYTTPELQVFGQIAEMTDQSNNGSIFDGTNNMFMAP